MPSTNKFQEWTCERCGSHERPRPYGNPKYCKTCLFPKRYQLACVKCGRPFEAKRQTAKYCELCKPQPSSGYYRSSPKTNHVSHISKHACKDSERLIYYGTHKQRDLIHQLENNLNVVYTARTPEALQAFIREHLNRQQKEQGVVKGPTKHQVDLIRKIENTLGVHFGGDTVRDANLFILNHKTEYFKQTQKGQ